MSEEEKKVKKSVKTTEPAKTTDEKNLAKAGKRSKKALEAAEEKQAKVAKKADSSSSKSAEDKPKSQVNPPRPKAERKGKKYRDSIKKIDKTKKYPLKDAIDLASTTSTTKFDATVEMHIRLNVDPRQADQNIRDSIVLPAGAGKTSVVAVFADVEDAKKAKAAGADIAESEEFLQRLDKGDVNFDVLIATPGFMPKLGKYAKLLGPKGLMPNPKSGTVTTDVQKAVNENKAGKIEYRVDSNGIVHTSVGKVSFKTDDLAKNADALISSIKSNKPSSIKGSYIVSAFITTSMGPSVAIDTLSL